MKRKGCAVFGILLAVIVIVVLVAGYIVESRYEAIFRAPVVPDENFVTGNTALKVVLRSSLARRRLAALLVQGRELPDWVLNMSAPEEMAILADADLETDQTRVKFFINYARLGPVIRDALNQSRALQAVPGVTWSPPEIVRKQKGVLLSEGTAPLPPEVAQGIRDRWNTAEAFSPPKVEGTHVLEAALENRNGKGFAIIAALIANNPEIRDSVDLSATMESFVSVSTLRAYADFKTEDELQITVIAEANPAQSDAPKKLKLYMDLLYISLRLQLPEDSGSELVGTSTVEGTRVEGNYTLSNVDKLLETIASAQ